MSHSHLHPPLQAPTRDPWGLYVHVPFCNQVCPFCDFNVVAWKSPPWQDFTQAVLAELRLRAAFIRAHGGIFRTVYFGGGTPSLAPPEFFQAILEEADKLVGMVPNAEISLEYHPGTATLEHVRAWRSLGINRISLGWQTSQENLLKVLQRGHSAAQSQESYAYARQAGFSNISADLMFAIPGETAQHLERDLEAITALQPEHISLYALTYHEGTPFFRKRSTGRLQAASESAELHMMRAIWHTLPQRGYEQYEVSAFARSPALRSQHNASYWTGQSYLGIGPGAHSLYSADAWSSGHRFSALRSLRKYLACTWQPPSQATSPYAILKQDVEHYECLSADQMWNERFLCALRTPAGLPRRDWQHRTIALQQAEAEAHSYGWLAEDPLYLRPTRRGLEHADSLAELFVLTAA